jgi:outer membrane receptor protein involved in Fe transport
MHAAVKPNPIAFALACFCMLSLAARPAAAQVVTGSLFGAVTDASGGRLPGVTVTVTSPQMIGGATVRTTNEEGVYRIPALPPGAYDVQFELPGFQTVTRRSVALLAGQSLPVDAQMNVGGVQETLTITGEAPLIDTRSSSLVNTQDSATLENIPAKRDFTQFLNLMPGVTDARYDFSPINNVHGSSSRQSVYSLDGVNTDDPNTNATSVMLPPDAFQEVQVTTAGITAEFGDASGAVFNFVTKSGGNALKGGVAGYLQNNNLQSNNVSSELQSQGVGAGAGVDHLYDGTVFVGGPLKKDRLWFFDNFRYLNQDEIRSDFSAPLMTRDKMNFAKLTAQVSEAHKIEFGFYYRNFSNFPYTAVASYTNSGDPRTWIDVQKKNYIYVPRWTAILGNASVLEVRGSSNIFALLAADPNNVGDPAYVDVATGIITGGSDQLFGDNRRNRHQVKADITRYVDKLRGGAHSLKFGAELGLDPVWQQRYLQGARGPDELAGCTDDCISNTPDTHHRLFNGAPFRVRLYNSPLLQRFENHSFNVYAQDQWVLGDRITVNAGVRYEHVTGDLPESTGGPGQYQPTRVTFPEQRGMIDLWSVSPRLGAVWDVRGDHASTIKVSGGRFYNQLNTSYVGIASPAGLGFREFDWNDANRDMVYQPGEEGTLRADTRPNPARLPRIDPDLERQYTDVYTTGYEQALSNSVSIAITGIFKNDANIFGTIDAAVPFSSFQPITVTNPISREPMTIYTLPAQFQGIPAQTVLTNPDNPVQLERKYKGLETVIRRRMQDGWQFEGSYVYGKGTGNVGNAFSDSQTAPYSNPNTLINRFGDLPMGPRHQFKLLGAWMAPYGITVSGYFEALSGIPWTETFFGSATVKGAATARFFRTDNPQILSETFIDVAVEPAGTRKMDTATHLDLRVEKKFAINNQALSGIVDVFNAFNASAVTLIRNVNMALPGFGTPAQVQLPRQIRLGVRWTF